MAVLNSELTLSSEPLSKAGLAGFLVCEVTLAKYFMSFGRRQGIEPFMPMPRLELHMATMRLSLIECFVSSVAIISKKSLNYLFGQITKNVYRIKKGIIF